MCKSGADNICKKLNTLLKIRALVFSSNSETGAERNSSKLKTEFMRYEIIGIVQNHNFRLQALLKSETSYTVHDIIHYIS